MKISEAVAFTDFYTSIISEEMNINLAYRLNKIISNLTEDIQFYQTELKKIFEDCVEKDDNGNYKTTEDEQNFILKKDKIDQFEQRFNDLKNIEINFDENNKLDINDFNNITITPAQLLQIQSFIK